MPTNERVKIVCPECGSIYFVRTMPLYCSCGAKVITSQGGDCLTVKVIRYVDAIIKWRQAGKPVRTDDQMEDILKTHCRPCEFFKDGICTHYKCGCTLSVGSGGRFISRVVVWLARRFGVKAPMAEKLRMATEQCPIRKW